MKTIVISAVNIRKGGTLSILRSCLSYLSSAASQEGWRVIAIVHKQELCEFPFIEYIELPKVAQSWLRRLWCEYVTMHTISKQLEKVDLWFSLHDTTPRVRADRQAVYCQTSFPFLKRRWRDWGFDPKIGLFSLLTRFAYRINIHRNKYLIVQAEWLRRGFSDMFSISQERFVVAPPARCKEVAQPTRQKSGVYRFFFAATPDCHKNFELICEAAKQLEQRIGHNRFCATMTINGQENAYTKWLYKGWSEVSSLCFAGFMDKSTLENHYAKSDCLIFPSRVETWGLPISEFGAYGKPMLLADLPYAYETSAGCSQVAFFSPDDAEELSKLMQQIIEGRCEQLAPNPIQEIAPPVTRSWEELFALLLRE